MAWVPKYVHDVFLSYAHDDNEGREEWVGSFKAELEFQIRVNLGGTWGGRGATVWWDEHRIEPGDSIRDSIVDALNQSAAVVSLCSPNYLSSGYCRGERTVFKRACGDGGILVENASRLLSAIVISRDDVLQFAGGPGSLYADFSGGRFPPDLGSDACRREMHRLAKAIAGLLEKMRERFPAVYVSLPNEIQNEPRQNTIDMLTGLSTAGYRRTSDSHPEGLDAPALAEEIHDALLSVHIVEDPADGLTGLQVQAALGTDKPMMVWLSETARKSARADEIRGAVASRGRECWEGLFSEFRDRVIQLLPRIAKGEWPEPRQTVRAKKTVLFLYHRNKDREDAASVLRRLQNDFEVARMGGPTDQTDGVLVYQKEAGDDWFRTKLLTVKEMRGVKAAWPVAPPDKGSAQRIASDFKFRPAPEFDPKDGRLLLSGADAEPLDTFIDLVNRSPAA